MPHRSCAPFAALVSLIGRCSHVLHSPYALQLVMGMAIGRLEGTKAGDEEMGTVVPSGLTPLSAPVSLDFPAQIMACTQINSATDFPVFHYKLQLRSDKDWAAFAKAAALESQPGAGCRVIMTLPQPSDGNLKRP